MIMRRASLVLLVALAGCATAPPPAPAPAAPVPAAPSKPAAAAPAAPAAPATPAPASAAAPTARSPHGTTVINPGFESMVPGRRNNDPEGWFSHQHAGTLSYRFTLDTNNPHGGARSLRIENIGPEPYGAITQTIDGKPYRGKTVKLSAWMRTQDTENAALTLAAMSAGIPLANNFMSEKPVKGTTGWTRYTITLPMPPGTEFVEVGAMIQGKGSLWFDDVEVEVAGP